MKMKNFGPPIRSATEYYVWIDVGIYTHHFPQPRVAFSVGYGH